MQLLPNFYLGWIASQTSTPISPPRTGSCRGWTQGRPNTVPTHTHTHTYTYIYYVHAYLYRLHIAHLRQEFHNSKFVIFQGKLLKFLKCYTFIWVQWRHNCSPAASFANSVMTLYLLKTHLQTLLSIPITQKCQILSCDTLVANERYIHY